MRNDGYQPQGHVDPSQVELPKSGSVVSRTGAASLRPDLLHPDLQRRIGARSKWLCTYGREHYEALNAVEATARRLQDEWHGPDRAALLGQALYWLLAAADFGGEDMNDALRRRLEPGP